MLTVDSVSTIVQFDKPMWEAGINCSYYSAWNDGSVDSVDGHINKVFSLNQFVSIFFSKASLHFASVCLSFFF